MRCGRWNGGRGQPGYLLGGGIRRSGWMTGWRREWWGRDVLRQASLLIEPVQWEKGSGEEGQEVSLALRGSAGITETSEPRDGQAQQPRCGPGGRTAAQFHETGPGPLVGLQ